MCELEKIGKVFTSKFVGTGPSSYKKKDLQGHGLTKVEKHYSKKNSARYCHRDIVLHVKYPLLLSDFSES